MPEGSENRSMPDMQLIGDFEASWQAIYSGLTNQNVNQVHDSDEVKSSIEQTVQRFLDHAKQIECFFLQKRLYLASHRPEQLIAEEIADIKAEIQRKDEAMQRYQDKLVHWQTVIGDTTVPTTPVQQPQAAPMHGPPIRPSMPSGMHPQMRPQVPHGIPQQMGHQGQQMPPGFMPGHPMQQQQPSNLQGHLAFLERTTSNIGMLEPR